MEKRKNCWIIPTDQPSRLAFDMDENFYLLCEEPVFFKHQELVENRNIYITSSEEIKEGDWILYGANQIVKIEIQINKNSEHFKIYGMGARRKIILTTDPKLIAEGVQSIDDEFLEWFVKNPTCEFVEVDEEKHFEVDKSKRANLLNGFYYLHKIIIPQEEPKQEKEEEYFKHLEKDKKEFAKEWEEIRQEFGFGKQETLEEAAEHNYPSGDVWTEEQAVIRRLAFKNGAKWQAERMYSEEDLRRAYTVGKHGGVNQTYYDFDEWFKQFKKK